MTSTDFGVYVIEFDDEQSTLYVGSTCKPFDATTPSRRSARGHCRRSRSRQENPGSAATIAGISRSSAPSGMHDRCRGPVAGPN